MKKRKTYEISVIDKTYSKTISDETKFYTSDTALELVFKLKETEYIFESAEIVLLNIDDRSLVTRPVSKVNNDFVYELDDDIIPHYGEWRGQLRFEAGGTYVSSPVKFRIENDLSNERPPQISDVQSWVSLKRYADSLTEELKQAVLSIEGVEDTFNANELERQNQFNNAEQSRQGAFDSNEANRTETFNTNEATRQENESTRQQAEGEREFAESNRASAEEQRKIDHANRSAELAGKADKVVIKNLVENGDFSNGLTGWKLVNARRDSENNFTFTGNLGYVYQNIYIRDEEKVYIVYNGAMVSEEGILSIRLAASTQGIDYPTAQVVVAVNQGESMTDSTVINVQGNYEIIGFNSYPSPGVSRSAEINLLQVINLTKTFGADNEPTKEEMDELIKVTGYIDGEYALNNKEMLIWTLALIRRNKNAIITLGGTV